MKPIHIYVKRCKTIKIFKWVLLRLVTTGKKNILIDCINTEIPSYEIIHILDTLDLTNNVELINIPFCISNFSNKRDNTYKSNLETECYSCNYAYSCKWVNNNLDKKFLKKKKLQLSDLYKERLKKTFCDIYLLLVSIWFTFDELSISSNKWVLYYFLFDGKEMFFSWTWKKYFYISEHGRIYIKIYNIQKCENLFKNKWKNLIFKDTHNLSRYIQIMSDNDIDITLLLWVDNDWKKEIFYQWLKLRFDINEEVNFTIFFDYFKKISIHKQYEGNIFYWKKSKIFNNDEELILPVINIHEWNYNNFPEEFVLVWFDTQSRFIPAIIKSRILLLERKTEISHWAIISRELKKNCIYSIDGIASNVHTWDIVKVSLSTKEIQKL